MRRRLGRTEGRYLEHRTSITVRFHEVDSMRIAWHGHYVTWMECGREALGRDHGLSYADFLAAGLGVPVVHLALDYKAPARYGDDVVVVTRLFERPQAKLEFQYDIVRTGPDGGETLLARGTSVQAFTDLEGSLRLNPPDLLVAFYDRWRPHMRETPPLLPKEGR